MRKFFLLLLLSAAIHVPAPLLPAQTSGPGTPGVPSLKDTLEKGLKARRPEEFAFVAAVVGKVNSGDLPKSLVDSTFLWSRRQRHPFQYFERALKDRAKKIGVTF